MPFPRSHLLTPQAPAWLTLENVLMVAVCAAAGERHTIVLQPPVLLAIFTDTEKNSGIFSGGAKNTATFCGVAKKSAKITAI